MPLVLRNVVNRELEFYELDGNLQYVEDMALAAQEARDAAMLFSRVFDSPALGLAGTTSGQYFAVPGMGAVYLNLYRNDSGAATFISSFETFLGGTLTGALNEAPPVTIASAATVDIGAAASNTVIVSGTASITAFDTIAAGAIRYIRATGAFTLTHNATSLIIPGGANIVAASGDVFRFESLGGGSWRMTGFASGSVAVPQPFDATLTSLATLGTAADRVAYTTGVDTWAETPLTAAGRALIDDASAAAQRATLGSTSVGDAVFIAATAAAARTAIGAVIGADVQAFDATLASLAMLGTAADRMAYTTGVNTWAETPLTAAGRALLDDATAAAQLTTLGTTAFNTFVSADQTITPAGPLTLAHGLGAAPRITSVSLVCQTAEIGYAVGDVVSIGAGLAAAIWPDATNLNIRYGSNPPTIINKTTGVLTALTTANWKARFLAIK